MRALDLKLLRDLRLMWSQALTIAAVVASGVAGFLTTLSAVDSLAQARDTFYAQAQFADMFAGLKRAPQALQASLREVPGVADVQTTSEFMVRVQVPGQSDPVTGLLIGVDRKEPARMNRLTLRQGRPAEASSMSPGAAAPDGTLPVWVSESFAQTRGLAPGSSVTAIINGRSRTLRIAGIALSPEYIFAGLYGMPDQRGFGVFWIDAEPLRAAYDMEGAFNRVAVKLAPEADLRSVSAGLQRLLAPYGGREVITRENQTSHNMLANEIREQHVLGTVLPAIFLGVAAFLLNVVISRLVARQREQIATLKALGYANPMIAMHYLKLVLVIVGIGFIAGVALGNDLGERFLGLYAEFFRIPDFTHRLAPHLVLIAFALTVITAVLGVLHAIRATVRLTPAEAMRPPSPGHYERSLPERLGITWIGTTLRMILREMGRKPLRSALTIAAIAASVSIVVMGNFVRDAMAYIVDSQFTMAMRQDASLWLTEPADDRMRHDIARLPGVLMVEPSRQVPVRIRAGQRAERIELRGLEAQPELHRIIDVSQQSWQPPQEGLLLTDRLARKLAVSPGQEVLVEVLTGRERVLQLRVAGIVQDMMGLNAYMRRDALNRALGEGDLATSYAVVLERGTETAFLDATRKLPGIAGAFSKATLLHNMQEISARNIRIMSTVLTVFAIVIAIGVVYNNIRIALSERNWELASLRVLGFTRGEVSALLLGEFALALLIALPLGMLMGHALVHVVTGLLASDQFYFPVVIQPRTYAFAALVVLVAGAASALVVRRRIDQLDMVAVLKTRD